MALTDEQLGRYSRHIILQGMGLRGQKRLMAGSVLIIGAGGLGSPAAMYLAAAGVGRIGIADADVVDLSNLQRQVVHATADVGRPKAESAAQTMRALNPDVQVEPHPMRVDAENIAQLVAGYDFIIDATDNFAAKFLINDACVLGEKPFSHAGVVGFEGQLFTYVPGEGPCYRCVFGYPPPPDAVPTCSQAGVVGVLPGVIGSLQALEAVKFLAGAGDLLTGRMLTCNALAMKFREVKLPRNPDCPICGAHPSITELSDEQPATCDLGATRG